MKQFNFPTDRVFTFTDAVFSIAITILVLEIGVPSRALIKKIGFMGALENLIPSFIGFFVSFMVIALYWKFYLSYSRYITQFDGKLFWYNIFLLLFVALLPFSTGFFVDSVFYLEPYLFYCGNLILLSFVQYLMLRLVLKRAKLKIDHLSSKWLRYRAFTTFLVWVMAFVLAFFFPFMARVCIVFIFVFQFFGKIYFRRKARKQLA